MSSMIKAVVVDDERYSREELKHLLNEFPFVEIIGEADSGESALIICMQQQPDVVFLDIEMPKMNGLEVAKNLRELKHMPYIVFATAYPNFAVEAFRYEAVDYLLKPFDEEQLTDTMTRLQKLLLKPVDEIQIAPSTRLAVELESEIHYIDPHAILYISRDERVSRIFTKDQPFESKMALKDLEERLKSYPFFRIHKSYLVNLNYVQKLIPWFNGAYLLELMDSEEKLSVSRNYVKALRKRLEL
ncbi:LytTR family DNA-binding domain-containing protein [Bacillus tianshenii]|uniref:LytR/AlgR family response regulator transcription factor n=1 Tax=Sutcliffiella tianshenii TaxID=1463404 RepID=UPI001CD6C2B3|nr:LytTR family DNA-binding domain-containing protein [Bacillus tianshenii]MCA1321110.1 LytTR family DNA-binding domain-containing protein [Bacillus tianshenii]